jgi:hypothetical protein
MVDIYDIDFEGLAIDSMPPVQRNELNNLLACKLCVDQSDLYDHFLFYKEGAELILSIWTAGGYFFGDMVIYLTTGEVYECMDSVTTDEPTTSTAWRKILNSFIGNDVAQHFNGTRIQLEYALNLRFFTNFSPVTDASDIYITKVEFNNPFCVGGVEANSSGVYTTTWDEEFVSETVDFDNTYNFKINFPLANYLLLGTDAEQVVRKFVDKLVGSKVYTIETY